LFFSHSNSPIPPGFSCLFSSTTALNAVSFYPDPKLRRKARDGSAEGAGSGVGRPAGSAEKCDGGAVLRAGPRNRLTDFFSRPRPLPGRTSLGPFRVKR